MKQTLITLAVAMSFGFAGSAGAAMSKADQKAAKDRIEADYKAAKKQCDSLKANAKDVCEAEAKGKRDVAILDFNLPDMDGVMLHRQIRQMDAELAARSVFMSGFVQSDSNLDYYTAQGGGFLAKPFDIRDVVRAVRGALGQEPDDGAGRD